ncbi:hypothetical protein IMSHALPRED_003451 [Imshaugia aleurites]|uniref:Uncharacterized protein n=1 Tax=Imshaugia aleurites TaxID=172621 RepID=A0A8H3J7Q5_9LECA|nr:hypothetical protein IMSHALPRED_003451 [Imshaugia aleurites]
MPPRPLPWETSNRTSRTPSTDTLDTSSTSPPRPPLPWETSNRTSRTPSTDTLDTLSSSSAGFGPFTTTRSRESNSDSSTDAPLSNTHPYYRNSSTQSPSVQEMLRQDAALWRAAGERRVDAAVQRAGMARGDVLAVRTRTEQTAAHRPLGHGNGVLHPSHSGAETMPLAEHNIRHSQLNDQARQRRSAEDSHRQRLTATRRGRDNASVSTSYDSDSEESLERAYEGRGVSARGDDYDAGNAGRSAPRDYGARAIRVRCDEWDDGFEGRSGVRGRGEGREMSR